MSWTETVTADGTTEVVHDPPEAQEPDGGQPDGGQPDGEQPADPREALRQAMATAQAEGDVERYDALTAQWRGLDVARPADESDHLTELVEAARADPLDPVAADRLADARRRAAMPAPTAPAGGDGAADLTAKLAEAQAKGDWQEYDRLLAARRASMMSR